MFLLPIAHERGESLRWPWITLSIIGCCLLLQLLTGSSASSHSTEELAAINEALEFFLEHPYLELDPRLQAYLGFSSWDELDDPELAAAVADREEWAARFPMLAGRHQGELDQLTSKWEEVRQSHPLHRWGVVPAELSAPTLVTYMFFHAGWMHLIGNLIILYLAGTAIEDLWGRPTFLAFYLVGGMAAGWMHALQSSDSAVPMVGASGAIAAVMGAFLVRLWKVRIKFFYLLFFFVFFKSGTFQAPAWVMLPAWFLLELIPARLGANDGVAHWAHVWGFVFGVGVAVLMATLRVEDRFLKKRIYAAAGVFENARLSKALEARAEGRLDVARELLETELAESPGNHDAVLALWDVARQEGRASAVADRLLQVIWNELQSGELELGLSHWNELKLEVPEVRVHPRVVLALAEALARAHRSAESAELLAELMAEETPMPNGMLYRIAHIAAPFNSRLSLEAARTVLGKPDVGAELRLPLERLVAQLETVASSPG